MDGTLAEFRKVDTLEKLYEKGYFLNLEPHMNVVDSIRSIVTDHSEIEVYILSSISLNVYRAFVRAWIIG